MSSKKSAGKIKHNRLEKWISFIWNVMTETGNGYKRHSLRNTGIDDDRRNDKLHAKEVISIEDGEERQKIEHVPFRNGESKIERGARLGTLTLKS